jgi:purine-binding chemotaxis protein CheW
VPVEGAVERAVKGAVDKDLQIIGFRVGRETFGLPISEVREILRVPEITAMPNAPEAVEGVMNLRGRIVPVIDLGRMFGSKSAEAADKRRVIVVEHAGRNLALLVHSASHILRIAQSEVEPTRDVLPEGHAEYVSGMGKLNDRLVILLDLKKILERVELGGLNRAGLNKGEQKLGRLKKTDEGLGQSHTQLHGQMDEVVAGNDRRIP